MRSSARFSAGRGKRRSRPWRGSPRRPEPAHRHRPYRRGVFFAASIKLYAKQEVAERKLAGALKATGQEVERLSKSYKQLASDIQATTTFGDEDLLGAASTLTRLAKISEDQMPRILELTADWAAFLGKDVNSAARDIGRAMADPVRNLSLLGRYGVQITDELKNGIEALVKTGRMEEARLVVWQELHKVVGGAARELAAVETGKWIQLKNTVGDLLELFGRTSRRAAEAAPAMAERPYWPICLHQGRGEIACRHAREGV